MTERIYKAATKNCKNIKWNTVSSDLLKVTDEG